MGRAAYEPGKVTVHTWGRKAIYQYELKAGRLRLTMPDGKQKTFLKLDSVPPDLEPKPLMLGQAKELPDKRVKSIQEELAQCNKVRYDPKLGATIDSDNTAYLIKLVQEIGWIDVPRFGAPASRDAFLIVQHSFHIPLMMAALPLIEQDMKAKRLDGKPYAMLFDRLQLELGKKQKYGTQLGANDRGDMVVMALEDRKNVDTVRKAIGLSPLADDLRFFEKRDGKAIKLQDDE